MKKSRVALLIVIYTIISVGVCGLLLFNKHKQTEKLRNELNSKLELADDNIENMQDKLEEKGEEISKLESNVDKLEGNVDDLEKNIDSLENTLKEANDKISAYEDDNYGIKAYGRLQVKGTKLCDEDGNQVQLKGMSTHGIAWYPRYTNAAAIKYIKDAGANVIRLAVYSDQNDSYLYEPEENMNYLYSAIENALVQNMYVIVDWHVLKDEDPNLYKANAVRFFEEVTKHYGNHKGIIYEICNEPNNGTTWDEIYTYASEIIPVIRKNAKDAVIIVGTPEHSFDIEDVLNKQLNFENVMYAFHVYIDATNNNVAGLNWLRRKLELPIPMFVTEWGIEDLETEGVKLYKENAVAFMDMMKERGISWCNWSLSNKDEIHSMFKTECDKYSGWTEEDLTFSGRIVIEGLKK